MIDVTISVFYCTEDMFEFHLLPAVTALFPQSCTTHILQDSCEKTVKLLRRFRGQQTGRGFTFLVDLQQHRFHIVSIEVSSRLLSVPLLFFIINVNIFLNVSVFVLQDKHAEEVRKNKEMKEEACR